MFIGLMAMIAHDPLGRVDMSSVPHQILMESLVENAMLKSRFRELSTAHVWSIKAITEWDGVDLDSNGCVISIMWMSLFPFCVKNGQGSMAFECIPPTVTKFFVQKNQLRGTIDTASLPASLKSFNVSENELSGEVDLTSLPASLERFHIEKNRFYGFVTLHKLPQSLYELGLARNWFTGNLKITKIPSGMKHMSFEFNRFEGDIMVSSLPDSAWKLTVSISPPHRVLSETGEEFSDPRLKVFKLLK